jgi:hypothetical protein
MEVFKLEKDINVFCVRAKSFPNGIGKSFGVLISLLPTIEGRTFYGISFQDKNGSMIYYAAVQETFTGEGLLYNCESFTINKGEYLTELLKGWKKDVNSIGLTFQKLAHIRTDTVFPCVEWYQDDNVLCMVRIDPTLSQNKIQTKKKLKQ